MEATMKSQIVSQEAIDRYLDMELIHKIDRLLENEAIKTEDIIKIIRLARFIVKGNPKVSLN